MPGSDAQSSDSGNALTQGDSSDFESCEICGDPTQNTAIPLRHSPGDGGSSGRAVQLRACDTCQRNLANVNWDSHIGC